MAAYSSITTAGASADWGFESAETGLFVESMSETASDPYEFLMDNRGRRVGFAYNVNLEHAISVSGEMNGTFGTTGLLADAFGTAATLVNDTASIFGITAGLVWLTSGTLSKSRNGWKSVSMSYSRYPQITS